MQKLITYILLFFLIGILSFSCNKKKYGNVSFWQQTGSGFGIINVTINDKTSSITSEHNSDPGCESSTTALFSNLEEGVYNYAAFDGTNSWLGTVTVLEGCVSVELN
jgi:hypothetical protein